MAAREILEELLEDLDTVTCGLHDCGRPQGHCRICDLVDYVWELQENARTKLEREQFLALPEITAPPWVSPEARGWSQTTSAEIDPPEVR